MEELPVPPQVAFALGPALVAAAGSGTVPATTARAVLALFPSADFISVQIPCAHEHGCMVSVSSLMDEGQTSRELLPSDSLAGRAFAARAPLSARPVAPEATCGDATRRHVLSDVNSAWSTWRTPFVLALPVFRDDCFSILESCLQLDVMDADEQAAGAPGVIAQYVALAESSACVGTITVGTRDKYLFCDGHLANLCLVSCVAAMHLTADMPGLLAAAPLAPAIDTGVAAMAKDAGAQQPDQLAVASAGSTVQEFEPVGSTEQEVASTASAEQEVASAGSASVQLEHEHQDLINDGRCGGHLSAAEASGSDLSGASSSLAKSGALSAKEAALLGDGQLHCGSDSNIAGHPQDVRHPAAPVAQMWSQHPLLVHYENEALEQEYVSWLADSYLLMQRVLNLVMGVPWILLAGLTEPWMLYNKAPWVWVTMIAYMLGYSVVTWCCPVLFRRHYKLLMATSWAFIAWFFPLTAGHIPIQVLPVESLRSLPWLPFSAGCLTNVVVPLYYMPRFKWFVPFQLVSLAVNMRHIVALVARLGGGASWALVTAWMVSVSVLLSTVLTYHMDKRSRAAFMLNRMSNSAAPAEQGVAKAAPMATQAKLSLHGAAPYSLPPRPMSAHV